MLKSLELHLHFVKSTGRILDIVCHDPSVSKSYKLHVDILGFAFFIACKSLRFIKSEFVSVLQCFDLQFVIFSNLTTEIFGDCHT